MIIGLYADDSTDQPRQQIQTAGAIFGWPAHFVEAERLWDAHLKRAGISYFKASEAETLSGEFFPEKLGMSLNSARAHAEATRRDLVSVLEQIQLSAVAVSLVVPDFKEVISSSHKARYYYGTDSTIMAYGRLLKSTIEFIHRDHPSLTKYSLSCTFDFHTDYLKHEAAYRSLKAKDIYCASMMGYIGHASDIEHPPLQMADLLAHEARHKSVQMLADSNIERPAFGHLSKAHSFYYIGLIAKQGLLAQLDEYPDPPPDGSPNEFKWTLE